MSKDKTRKRGVRTGRLLFLIVVLALVAWASIPEVAPIGTGAWIRKAGLSPRYETVGGVRIRYVRTGQGPTVVLLHGIASSLYTWKDVIPVLAKSHDVIALDFPGFGDSDRPASLTWDGLPTTVLGLMERLGVAKASLVGNSMGGAVGVLAEAQAPLHVDKLVLIDSAGFNLAAKDRPAVLRLLQTPLAPALGRLPIRRALTRLGLRQVFFDDSLVTSERIDEYVAPMLRPGSFEGLRALLTSADPAMADRFEAAARAVQAPTLVIWGADDQWVRPSDADRFVATIRGSRKVVIPRCGHMPQEEKPHEVAVIVNAFLTTTTPSPQSEQTPGPAPPAPGT